MSQIDILTRFFKLKVPKFDIATWHDYIKQDFIAIDSLLANFVDAQNFKGAWQTSTEYEKDDLVFIENTDSEHYGELFRVLITHTTTADDFDTFYENNPTYYDVQGAIGSQEALKNAKAWASKIDGMVTEKGIPIDYSSKAYAIGGVGTETNNAKYYKEQAEAVLSDTDFINVSTDLANPSSKIKTCANNIDNINSVNNNKTNIDTIATDLTGTDTIGTVASNISNVNAVGTNISAVTNVDSNMSDINDCVTNIAAIQDAPNQAQSAEDYATESRVWAIGDDDAVDDYIVGEHSSHTYANLAMAIANTDEDVPIAEGINAENVIRGPKGDPGADGKDGKDGQDGADATINGENTVTITATDGVSLSQSGTNLTISGATLQNNITNIQNVVPDGTTVSNKLTNSDIVDEKIKNTVYRSLSNTQVTTLLDNGTYNGKEVTSGEIFTTEDGAFKKFNDDVTYGGDKQLAFTLPAPSLAGNQVAFNFGSGNKGVIFYSKDWNYGEGDGDSCIKEETLTHQNIPSYSLPRYFNDGTKLYRITTNSVYRASTDGTTWGNEVSFASGMDASHIEKSTFYKALGKVLIFAPKDYWTYQSYTYADSMDSTFVTGTFPASMEEYADCRVFVFDDEVRLLDLTSTKLYSTTDFSQGWTDTGIIPTLPPSLQNESISCIGGIVYAYSDPSGNEQDKVLYYSADRGETWNTATIPNGAFSITYCEDTQTWVAIRPADTTYYYTSIDGHTFTAQTPSTGTTIYGNLLGATDCAYTATNSGSSIIYTGAAHDRSLISLSYDKNEIDTIISGISQAVRYSANNPALVSVDNKCTWILTHNLNTKDIIATVYDINTGEEILCDKIRTSINELTIEFVSSVNISANSYKIVLLA